MAELICLSIIAVFGSICYKIFQLNKFNDEQFGRKRFVQSKLDELRSMFGTLITEIRTYGISSSMKSPLYNFVEFFNGYTFKYYDKGLTDNCKFRFEIDWPKEFKLKFVYEEYFNSGYKFEFKSLDWLIVVDNVERYNIEFTELFHDERKIRTCFYELSEFPGVWNDRFSLLINVVCQSYKKYIDDTTIVKNIEV